MRYSPMVLVFCLMAWSAPSQSAGVDRVDIDSYGIASGPVGVREGMSSNGIEHWRTDNTKVVQVTTRIPACFGIRFGFMFSIVGAPGGAPVTLREIYRFPRSGLHRQGVVAPIYDSYFDARVSAGQSYGLWYEFDYPWELALGDWTFELRDGNRLLTSKTFTVVPPGRAECPGLGV